MGFKKIKIMEKSFQNHKNQRLVVAHVVGWVGEWSKRQSNNMR
jgi:hypothetical protein